MAYLYLNFIDNLEQGSKNWDDFYTSSLTEQYEVIKRKIGNIAADNLQQFIGAVFPMASKSYYISMPGFDRRMQTNKRGKQCIYNIVIRPERDYYINSVLPNNYDVIIIGDLTYDSVTAVTVKGIELIDTNVAKFGEKRVNCTAACAFSKVEKVNRNTGNIFVVPNYGTNEVHDEVLTNDFIYDLCETVFPVPNQRETMQVFGKWQTYLQFRKYYLGKLSERCEVIKDIDVLDAYMLTKEAYKRDSERLSEYLLDGIEQFAKGEQIVLSRNVQGSEGFPLIRVCIEQNRKKVLSLTVGKNGRGKPKYEVNLQRYTRDAMGLSKFAPKYDENGNLPKGYRFNQYLLGERYLFAYVDVEPDCTDLERKTEKAIQSAYSEIEKKYASIIAGKLQKFLDVQVPIITAEYDKKHEEYRADLNATIQADIERNSDKEVRREYEAAKKKATAYLDSEYKRYEDSIEAKIKAIKKEKLSEKEKTERIEKLQEQLQTAFAQYMTKCEEELAKVVLRDFYIARNLRLLENKRKSLDIEKQAQIERVKAEKKKQLDRQYEQQIKDEKKAAKAQQDEAFATEKAERIENETTRRYQIYFRPNDITDKITEIKKSIEAIEPIYLVYDNRAEKAKIERQEKALASIMGGYVKNPYLPTYLFAPTELKQISRVSERDPDWCLESLNDGQRLAVKRALASESIFLLQGPPGTGKTQVIAEITAQLAKQGKKVLISSETHKAIDNVFERLPKIPEIRPLRLIPSQNAKETNYSPERLVDNFYANISGNLEKQVNRFEHFEETKVIFDEEMRKLRAEYDKLLRLKKENARAEAERERLITVVNQLNRQLETKRNEQTEVKDLIEQYRRTQRYVESYRFSTEEAREQYITSFKEKAYALMMSFSCFVGLSVEKVGEIARIDVTAIREELSHILNDDVVTNLKSKQAELRNILQGLLDPETFDAPEEGTENYADYKKYQAELIAVSKQLKQAQTATEFDFSESQIFAMFPSIVNDKDLLRVLPEQLTAFKIKLQSLISDITATIERDVEGYIRNETEIAEQIADIQLAISQNKNRYEELGNNEGIAEYGELSSLLKQKITRFFRDFSIIKEYDSENLETAFQIIDEEWNKIEYDYKRTKAENAAKIPMYREIVRYLSQEDILEEDRQAYTRELYNCVNVFGITCTSRDRFTPAQLQELGKYGIESVDIKKQGIDVVIVDEVSKSSFLDLLIPILYGKTIILVGDHRQLPPMYDLRHLRGDDFEGLDEEIITKDKNDEFTALYEECFFKTLYEKVPDDFRVMLTKQYRCHSHIMEVFNHFYGGRGRGLTIGKKQQDDEKEHGLTVRINGSTIIDPKYHVYFIDCDQKESSAYEGSTSKINEQEAEVAMRLLRELDSASVELVKQGKIKVSKDNKTDERPSVGVICTYGDQAGLIKKKRKYQQFTGFSGKPDERLIISTVDDFQGDERDIIILSMVRNPSGNRYDADFIKKFERINVALSRARKMLIVVGSRKFLSEAGIIDLPDLSGNHALDQNNFHVYEKIIETIYARGRVLVASDIIGG